MGMDWAVTMWISFLENMMENSLLIYHYICLSVKILLSYFDQRHKNVIQSAFYLCML